MRIPRIPGATTEARGNHKRKHHEKGAADEPQRGQFWILVHIALGVGFLHAFAGGFATLLASTTTQLRETRLKRLVRVSSTGLMAAISWLAVVTGTWVVYPPYRAEPPAGTSDLLAYPQVIAREPCRHLGLARLRHGVEGARRLDRALPRHGRCLRGDALRAPSGR